MPNHLVACAPCWRRLPAPLRSAIWRALRQRDAGAHGQALGAAVDWYRRNPLPQVAKPDAGRVDKPEDPRLF